MKYKTCLLLCALSLCFTPSFTQDNRINQIDSIFSSLYSSGKFNGNVLIAERGQAIYQKSFGLANEQTQQPLDINSMSLLGSVSKQFTAAAIVLLKERGMLKYEDDIQEYLPGLPYKGITIRHLLTHTSGLPDYISMMDQLWDKTRFASNMDMINMLALLHPPVFFEPGARYAYSNTGYALLAQIIEIVSGDSYTHFMEDALFQPLGMKRTIVYTRRYQPRRVKDYALGYVYNDSLHQYSLPDVDPKFRTALWEDGIVGQDGVNSTAGDLLIWDQSMYANTLISHAALDEIFTPAKVTTGETDYGFGWHIKSLPVYGTVTYHSGGWPGYIAYIERHVDNNKTIIILRNRFTPETRIPIDQIRSILYGQQQQQASVPSREQ
jgi:CubicO group peptidase (beta-lactamase class C family)